MKYILVFLFSMISIIASGQIEDAIAKKYFDDGLANYKSGLYELADSLFNLSYSVEPSKDAFYFKTITSDQYMEKCEKCKKWEAPLTKGAIRKYLKECFIVDSISYPEFATEESIFYCKLSMYIGDSAEDVRLAYCKKDVKDNSVSEICIGPDSSYNGMINPIAHFPDLGKIPSDKIIYSVADEMPEYFGGDVDRIKFLTENIKYPDEAKENGISGMVILSFIIDEQGYVKDVRILRSVDEYIDAEALRVTRLMPHWIPGKENGQPVKVQFNMPIKFTLN